MTYRDDLDTGQGAKLMNQDISGCLFLCLKYTDTICNFSLTLSDHSHST